MHRWVDANLYWHLCTVYTSWRSTQLFEYTYTFPTNVYTYLLQRYTPIEVYACSYISTQCAFLRHTGLHAWAWSDVLIISDSSNASTPTELYFPVIWLLIVLKNLCSSFLMARSWISINLMQSGRWCGPSVHDRVTSRAWDFSAFKFQIHLYDSLYSKALTGP